MVQVYKPGQRKGNRTCIVRGYVEGKQHEITTNTTDPRRARTAWNKFAKELGQCPRPRRGETFAEIADEYMEAVSSSRNETRYIETLKREIGDMLIGDIRLRDLQAAANSLYRGGKNETKNRQALTPAASVLHWATKNELRDYLVVEKFKEDKPRSSTPKPDVQKVLLANTKGRENLLLTILFYQGWRITETLSLRLEHIDMHEQTLLLYVRKARTWKEIAMHPTVFEVLANADLPDEGRVFSWGDRHNVYRWLTPLCKALNVEFTPHMARHQYGTMIRDSSDLVAVGSWTSEKSTQRYVGTPDERIRLVHSRLGKGKRKGRMAK